MYTYYVIYRTEEKTTPTGVFVRQQGKGHDLIWDHRAKAWVYDPELVARFLGDYDEEDRYQEVDRETAERITPGVTGGEGLPDEETIAWIFRWEGRPPQG
jgi:hypothetical protein